MKSILLILVSSISICFGDIHVDGSGFFPIMVQVVEKDSRTPIEGAKVRIADLPQYENNELDPEKQIKVLPTTLGKNTVTNNLGVAVVFYHGRWGEFISKTRPTYSRALPGTIIVVHNNKEIFRQSLKEWITQRKITSSPNQAPWIVVTVVTSKDTIKTSDDKTQPTK